MKESEIIDEIEESSKSDNSSRNSKIEEAINDTINYNENELIEEKLTIQKFRKYLGIIGKKGNNFIIERLYQTILRNRKTKIFPNSLCPKDIKDYFKKLNNYENNFNYSYLYFDITNKGYISKNDFIKVISHIYIFICKINNLEKTISNDEIGDFFDYLLLNNKDSNSLCISKTKFILLLSNNIINLYDLIYKKTNRNNFNLSSDNFNEMNNILLSIQKFKKIIIQKQNIESDLSLFTETYFSSIENNIINNIINNKTILSTYNNIETLNYFAPQEKKEIDDDIDDMSFSIDEKEKEKDNNIITNNDSEICDQVVDIDYVNIQTLENIKMNKNKNLNEQCENILNKNKGKKFSFLKPFISKDNELNQDLKNNNIDIEKCLILIDKTDFISYIDNIEDSFENVKNNILSNYKIFKINNKVNFDITFAKPLKAKHLYKYDIIESFNHFNLKFFFYIYQSLQKTFESLKLFNINNNVLPYKINHFDYSESNQYQFYSICLDIELNNIQIIFNEYAPKIFYNIRFKNKLDLLSTFNIENLIFYLIIGNITNLSDLIMINQKNKDEFIIFSHDKKYILKSISENEFEFLISILTNYYNHIINNKKDLLLLIELYLGLYSISIPTLNIKSYFILETNIFYTENKININKIYDLKGCSLRKFSKGKNPLNDIDFLEKKEKIKLNHQDKLLIYQSIIKDTNFLSENNISNYSFYIGIGENINNELLIKDSGFLSSDKKYIYYFGIIDILTCYKGIKKMENLLKSFTQNGEASIKPPLEYKERLRNFIKEIMK